MKTQTKNKPKRTKNKNPFKISWNGVPATVRKTLFEVSLYESLFASIFWHIISFLLICLIIFALNFFGIVPKIFPKIKPKIQDIEFILKDKSRHKIPHKIKPKLSNINSDKAAPQKSNHNILEQITKKIPKQNTAKTVKKHSKSSVSDFAIPTQNMKSFTSGLNHSGKNRQHASGVDSSNYSNAFDDTASGSQGSSKGINGGSGFDKNATRQIITTYDISPYVNELKRDIRWNWKVPKDNSDKKVELFLRIAKDGRIIILNVKKTSEIAAVDDAALNAVKKCIPLNPLPSKYAKNYLDVIFSFNLNSIGIRY